MPEEREEFVGDSYEKKAERLVNRDHGGGKNEKHWHKDGAKISNLLRQLDDIDKEWKDIKSAPYRNCRDRLEKLEKNRRHVRHQLNERGKEHAIRGKGHSFKSR